jgi:hypothetical protein
VSQRKFAIEKGADWLPNLLIALALLSGPCRTRTYDPMIKSHLLYQLS